MIGRSYADRFRIEAQLRPRVYGTAWKAWSLGGGEVCELVMLGPEICGLPDAEDRFSRLMRSLAGVEHPHLAEILDYGVDDDGGLYFAIPLAEATPLADLLTDAGPMDAERVALLGVAVTRALQALRDASLAHGGLTAQSLELLGRDGAGDIVRVRDAGLASLLSVAPVSDDRIATLDPDLPLLLHAAGGRGQRRGQENHDVYGLGAVLFECATGRRLLALLEAAGPTPISRDRAMLDALVGTPNALADVLRSLTALRADDRIASPHAAEQALRHAANALHGGSIGDDAHSAPGRAHRATHLGIGPPGGGEHIPIAILEGARRTSSVTSGPMEPVDIAELTEVAESESDELPPDRSRRAAGNTHGGLGVQAGVGTAVRHAISEGQPPAPPRTDGDATVAEGSDGDPADPGATVELPAPGPAKPRSGGATTPGAGVPEMRPVRSPARAEAEAEPPPPEAQAPPQSPAPIDDFSTGMINAGTSEPPAVDTPSRQKSARRAFSDVPLPTLRSREAGEGADAQQQAQQRRRATTQRMGVESGIGASSTSKIDMTALPVRNSSRTNIASGIATPSTRPSQSYGIRPVPVRRTSDEDRVEPHRPAATPASDAPQVLTGGMQDRSAATKAPTDIAADRSTETREQPSGMSMS